MAYSDNKYIDQFHCQDGWRFTEDISFLGTFVLTLQTIGSVNLVPVSFSQPPFRSFNQVPEANSAFLVLRHLSIDSLRPQHHRHGAWQWQQGANTTFPVQASTSGGQVILGFLVGPTPANVSLGLSTPLAVRRLSFGTIPANVTITKVEVKAGWSANYDDLGIASPITGNIDLGTFYDAQYGLINDFVQQGVQTEVDIRITYNNTNASIQNVPLRIYGMQKGVQSAQWLISFQPSYGGGLYNIGEYDDNATPCHTFLLDKVIPVQINDTGIVNLGNLVFKANFQIAFYATQSTYDIMLTCTLAYLVPV